jgi:hypothetical protein
MASETITIAKEEYDFLVKCRHIVDAEFEEAFSSEFIEAVKESEEAYRKGEYVKAKNSEERKKLFASL